MATSDELWAWVQPAIRELRENTADPTWEQWQSRLLELLGVSDATDHPVSEDLVRELDDLPEDERTGVLDSDRLEELAREIVDRHADAAAEQPEAASESEEGDWAQFLVDNGPTWDGTAESWAAFREWLVYEAGQQDVLRPIAELLDYLEAMTPGERITALAEYGVVIAAAPAEEAGEFAWVGAEHAAVLSGLWGGAWEARLEPELTARWGPDWQAHPADHKAAWLADLVAQGAFAEPVQPEPAPPEVEAALDDLAARIKSIPGIEALSEDEVAAMISNALARKVS